MDTRREQIIDIVTREFIGPDPINKPGMLQDNGEEILSSDPPRIRYAAGILFPQKVRITAWQNNSTFFIALWSAARASARRKYRA